MKKIIACSLVLLALTLSMVVSSSANYVLCPQQRMETLEYNLPSCGYRSVTGAHLTFKIGSAVLIDRDVTVADHGQTLTFDSGTDFTNAVAALTNGVNDAVEISVLVTLSTSETVTLGGSVSEAAFFFPNHLAEQGHPPHTDFSGLTTPTAIIWKFNACLPQVGSKHFALQYTVEIQ